MKLSEKVRTQKLSVEWSKRYIEKAKEMLTSGDSESLENTRGFRTELWLFIERIESRWIKHKSWSNFNDEFKAHIQELYDDLCDLELELARQNSALERSKRLQLKMDEAALPQGNSSFMRNVRGWNRGPLRFTERFEKRIKRARLPIRGGA